MASSDLHLTFPETKHIILRVHTPYSDQHPAPLSPFNAGVELARAGPTPPGLAGEHGPTTSASTLGPAARYSKGRGAFTSQVHADLVKGLR